MLTEEQFNKIFKKELSYSTSRSGGKGGQNVNKVETKVELEFDINASEVLSDVQKRLLLNRYPGLIQGSIIQIIASEHRSQLENKELARNKFIKLIQRLLLPVKKRVKTKPGKAAKQKKLNNKKIQGEKKVLRKKLRDF